jgi:tRNA threonylcarbamoyl adenosine modification protein (Sua5/YciO/YrdC/YwlC family)
MDHTNMPPVVVDLKKTEDPRDVVHRAVQALAEGKLVAVPTETVYGLAASALQPAAVEKLMQVKGRPTGKPLALAIHGCEQACDYAPDLSPLAQRLARRCWPGPLTLVLDDQHPDSLVKQLSPLVQQAVSPQGTIGLRVPAHDTVLSILRLCAGPLVLSSANRSGGEDPVTAAEALEVCGDDVTLILDDGKCRFGQPSSVVRVQGNSWEILRPGVFGEGALRQLSTYMILFVCTGNTCRSPMAETVMRDLLARRLGVSLEELEQRGLMVMSAGISAMAGGGPASEAVDVMARKKLDLRRHESQPLTERLVRFADLILTMTRGHRDAILAQWPSAAGRVHLVCQDGRDVADPIGGPVEMYLRCAEQIEEQLRGWLDTLDLSSLLAPVPNGGQD